MTYEEKLNYLKNKISMELKNTDTQLGFEIICKRLSELEKENKQLKENRCCNLSEQELCLADDRLQIVLKENARLKAIEAEWKSCFLSCSSPYCVNHFPAVKMEGELGNMTKREGE